jgi:predicted ATPase|tara:strand:+ start:7530 stop:7757 length:228 start_codon:yes stop_codon:yes gene_type:complete
MTNRFVLSGGPGGGKSALLAALAERGYPVVPESARAIIRSRLQSGLAPRPEPAAFAQAIHAALSAIADCRHAMLL